VRFLSHEDALGEFRKEFANDKDMLSKITADQLPTSFRFRVANGTEARVLAEVQTLPGVTDVADPHAELCGPLLDSLNGGTRA
jgi:cell division protein FtsX